MSAKKWCIGLFCSIGLLIILIAITVVYVDPYMHYHEPIIDMAYSAKEVYLNDGMTKNCKYEALITGTSTSGGFSEEQAEFIFGKKFICVPFPGESFKRVSDNLKVGLSKNPDLNMVIWGLDTMWFIADADWLQYEDYPDYLYDSNPWNDVNYLLNGDVFMGEIVKPLCGRSPDQTESIVLGYDDNKIIDLNNGNDINRNTLALANYQRPSKEERSISEEEKEEIFKSLDKNIKENVISRIKDYPNVTFYIFFPPYSILWWDSMHQLGEETLRRRLDMEQAVIEELLVYKNVRVFSFANNFDLTCDLNNYVDDVHYTDEVYTWILYKIKNEEYELNKDNYKEYMKNISDFYSNYEYDNIFTVEKP